MSTGSMLTRPAVVVSSTNYAANATKKFSLSILVNGEKKAPAGKTSAEASSVTVLTAACPISAVRLDIANKIKGL
jgi:hypothetical protein